MVQTAFGLLYAYNTDIDIDTPTWLLMQLLSAILTCLHNKA